MLRLTLPSRNTEGVWFDFRTRDVKIRLKIRPLSNELAEKMEKNNTRYEFVKDSETRQMNKVPVVNAAALFDEKIDYVIEDMEGVEIRDEDTGAVIPNTDIRAKKAILLMKQPEGEQPISTFIFDTSRELTIAIEKEKEKEIKNL